MKKIALILLIFATIPAFADDNAAENAHQASLRGLKWLADHQFPNGGWCFDSYLHPQCKGQCMNPGFARNSVIAATAVATLPFLDRGITHKTDAAEYGDTVKRSLAFLLEHGKTVKVRKNRRETVEMLSFAERDFGMAGHALATLCLTDTLIQTRDPALRKPAQQAVDFIIHTQNPSGGWGNTPQSPEDTLCTALEMLTLNSAYLAYQRVPYANSVRAKAFIDSLYQPDTGMFLASPDGKADATSTAAGHLMWAYYGVERDDPRMVAGVKWLDERGFSEKDPVYDYFAGRVMYHHGTTEQNKAWRERWYAWKVRTQCMDEDSHTYGSWYFPDADFPGAKAGGRLLHTAIMTLIPNLPSWPPPERYMGSQPASK